jgi:hypothetical protein
MKKDKLDQKEIDRRFYKLLIEKTVKNIGRPLTDKEVLFLI